MKNIFLDINKKDINDKIKKVIENEKVNNLKLFVTSDEAKLSVTLSSRYYSEKHDINSSPNEIHYSGYHGLHPSFDENYLKDFLEKNDVNNEVVFWQAIKSLQNSKKKPMNLIFHEKFWDKCELEKRDSDLFDKELIGELEEILLGRAILHMASHFGFIFKFKDKLTKQSFEKSFEPNKYIKIEDDKIYFLGIVPYKLIEKLSLNYSYYVEDEELFIENTILKKPLKEVLTFKKDFLKYFRLIDSAVYYSGVMPRVMEIELKKEYNVSKDIKPVILNVSRTTYATVDFMDNPKILKHDFFNEYRKSKMIEFDNYEDRLQKKYLYSDSEKNDRLDFENEEIEKLNKYLKYSLNTHTVAVSANIETKDGFLILGKRGGQSIDAGEYYCSANGQSEFRDKEVRFYRESVFEDLPSMEYDSEYRIDLNQEIQRECIAELGVSQFKTDWKYHGISYLSINNFVGNKEITKEDSEKVQRRRMHFNVLTGNKTDFTFEEVLKGHENATEKFENSKIKGIKTYLHKNNKSFINSLGFNFIKWLNDRRSDIFLIIIFIFSIAKNNGVKDLSIISILEVVIMSIYMVLIVVEYISNKEINKLKITKHFIIPKYFPKNYSIKELIDFNIDDIFSDLKEKIKCEKEEKVSFHAILLVMYTLYFLDKRSEIK